MAKRQLIRLTGALAAIVSLMFLAAAPVGAQEEPAPQPIPRDDGGPTNIGDALEGRVGDVSASAAGGFMGETIQLTLTFENTSTQSIDLAVPRGSLFESDDPSEQTIVAAGLAVAAPGVAPGEDPVITVDPGESAVDLIAFCAQQLDLGPNGMVPLHWAGVAEEPLTTVVANIDDQRPDDVLGQDAVWWITDDPYTPVPASLAPLLEGVDTKAFADEPTRAVPDPLYTPIYEGGESGYNGYPGAIGPPGAGGSRMGGVLLVGALVAIGLVVAIVASTRSSQRHPATAAYALTTPAGWYVDPGSPQLLRYWDGGRWTPSTRYR